MNGQMNILDADMNVISVGTGVDCRLEVVDLLQVQAYFQLHLAEERHLHNDRDLIFGSIWSGGEVYGAGISLTIHL